MERHSIISGKLNVYKREDSRYWQCSSFMNGKNHRQSSKETNLARAKVFALDWYAELCARLLGDEHGGRLFIQAAQAFIIESGAPQSSGTMQAHEDRLRLHLVPYFDTTCLSGIDSGAVQQYRAQRLTEPERGGTKGWKPPSRKTIEDEIATLRLVLETAQRHGWIDRVPDLSDPYEPKGPTEPRPWFTPWEYRRLCDATRRNAERSTIGRGRALAEHLHDYVVIMANTGLKPSEAEALTYGDVEIVRDDDTGERILEIVIRDGDGTCISTPAAVAPFEEMIARNRPQPADHMFPSTVKKLFNDILTRNNLKYDRAGKPRTPYSLRHSYICFRLLECAGFDELARNCRASVETIENHYAAHLPDLVGALPDDLRSEHRSAPQLCRQEDDSGLRPEA